MSTAAADNPSSLKGFEAAFRHGQAKSSLEQLGSLVCWDKATPEARNRMYRELAAGFSYVITRIDIAPFEEPTGDQISPPKWSMKPIRQLIVWYADDLGQPAAFTVRYPIGKRDGKYMFAVMVKPETARYWNFGARLPPARLKPTEDRRTPVKATDDPYLQRFMSDSFKVVDRPEDIDRNVFALLRSKIGKHLRFAERDQPFQVSDVPRPGDETLPDRQFALAGHNSDILFIKYVHGGFYPYGVLVIFSRANQSWKIVFSAYGDVEGSTLDDIRHGIQLGRYFRGGDFLY